jgi:zona occludens toxin (predicted ATPase)
MITLITAVPGSGKTLYTIGRILKALADNRPVYARIDGLLIDKVKPAPDDWRDTPEGSLVIYDEAQEVYPSNAKPGIVTDERLTAMEVHRHTGHDLVFITQAPTFIHHHIRKLVGEHVHLYRPNGIQGANLYTWNFAVTDPNDRREQERADHVLWKYPKDHFKLYKSATIHTHKFRVPKKIAILIGMILMGTAVIAYGLSDGLATLDLIENQPGAASGEAGTAPAQPIPTPFQWTNTEPVRSVSGCVDSRKGCFCYDAEMTPLDLPVEQCKSIIQSPIPRSLITSGSNNKEV